MAGGLGLDGQAIRLHRAIATGFAHIGVDEHAFGGVWVSAAFAAAAFFGGAGLVVNDDGNAFHFAHLLLQAIEFIAVVDGDAVGYADAFGVFFRLIADDDEFGRAFCQHLLRDLRHGEHAIHRLTARHRHRIVIQNFVSDVGLGGDGCAYRQQA